MKPAGSADLDALLAMTREQLHGAAQRYFKTGGRTEPEVALVVHGKSSVILKDYARTPGWFGLLIAPILLWREATALQSLDGLAGIPRLYRRLDRRGLLMEYLPARSWPQATAPDAAYARLERLLQAMHARGIAHCDLRAPGNMLVDDDGQPYIVDFVARMRRGRRWNRPWNWLFDQFVAADHGALSKLRMRYARHLATDVDRARLAHRGRLERSARAAGDGIRRLVRWFVAERSR